MKVFALLQRRSFGRIIVVVGIVSLIAFGLLWRASFDTIHPTAIPDSPRSSAKRFIVASLEKDDVSWLDDHLSDWKVTRFIVDNASAQFTVPKNKGREAMVYLTYMIDAYENLPDVMVFMHSERYQWHNDDPLYDGVSMLQDLQLPYVISEGYANLRCVWNLGCPSELKFGNDTDSTGSKSSKSTQIAYPQAFQELFPGEPLPSIVGVPCCAQFALTREKIRERPIEDYQRYREWLLDTSLEDHVSGRIFEYAWHLIFGKSPVHCPSAKECYCNTFGLCNLECDEDGKCGERWSFPRFSTLPNGWPVIGWDGESRDEQELERLRKTAIISTNQTMVVQNLR